MKHEFTRHAPPILSVRNNLKMIGIDATFITTKVIYFQSFRYLTFCALICKPVGLNVFSFSADNPISKLVISTKPQKAP